MATPDTALTDQQRNAENAARWASLPALIPNVQSQRMAPYYNPDNTPKVAVPSPVPAPALQVRSAPVAAAPPPPATPLPTMKGITPNAANVMINGVPPGTPVATPDDLAKQFPSGPKFAGAAPGVAPAAAPGENGFSPEMMQSLLGAMSQWSQQQQQNMHNPQPDVLSAAREARLYNAALLDKAVSDVKDTGFSIHEMLNPSLMANRIAGLYGAALGGTMDQRTAGEVGQAGTGYNTSLASTSDAAARAATQAFSATMGLQQERERTAAEKQIEAGKRAQEYYSTATGTVQTGATPYRDPLTGITMPMPTFGVRAQEPGGMPTAIPGTALDSNQNKQPLPNHVQALRSNPSSAPQFDLIYGSGAAAKILGK